MNEPLTHHRFILHTERLLLAPLTLNHLQDYYQQILGNPNVMKTMKLGRSLSPTEAQATLQQITEHWEQHPFGYWGVFLKPDHHLIGHCALRYLDDTPELELSYAIAPAYWGQGLALEAAQAVMVYGFEQVACDRIWARSAEEHQASHRIMQKLGMTLHTVIAGDRENVTYHMITKSTYQSRSIADLTLFPTRV